MVAAMGRFWNRENFEEGKRCLRTALEKDPGTSPAARAKALAELGFILIFQQNYGPAIAALDEAVALYKGLGDRTGAAFALANLGWAMLHGYYRERLLSFVGEGQTLIEEGLEAHPRAYLSIVLAAAMVWQGDLDLAASRLEEAVAMSRELGNIRDVSMALFNLGGLHLKRGDADRAMGLFEEGARTAGQLGDVLGSAYYIWICGGVNARLGRHLRAATLWGAAEALREQMGMSFSRYDLGESGYEGDLATVRSALDESSFDAAWAAGRSMSLREAIDYALAEPAGETPATEPARSLVAEPAAAAEHPEQLRIFALGEARVERDGRPLASSADWIQKPRELLFYLLSHPKGRTREQVGIALWPEASASQLRSSFHDAAFRLRRALGAKEWISFKAGRYAFDRSLPYSYDAEAFEWNLSEARRLRSEDPEQAAVHLQRATSMYAGDFLEDGAYGEWAMERQDELRREYGEALLLLGRLLSGLERHSEAAEAYRKAIAHDGFMEEAHRGLMRAHAALGERGRALRQYEELSKRLDERLGVRPTPETDALYESLRTSEEV
jgi:two-component SAPR family response regulator